MPVVGTTLPVEVGEKSVLQLGASDGLLTVHLVMPAIDRSVEITGSPSTAALAVDDAAIRASIPTSSARAQADRCLRQLASTTGLHIPPTGSGLVAALGGAAFPLLATAYEAQAGPIGNIPAWAVAPLRQGDPISAARAAFARQATRPVAAALARSLTRCGTEAVDLSRLALALIGSEVLEPDHLAEVLTVGGPAWDSHALPSPAGIAQGRRAARRWGTRLTRGYLLEAAADDASRRLFLDCVVHALDLGDHAPRRLPARLSDLRALYRLQVRTASSDTAVHYRALYAPSAADSRAPRPDPSTPIRTPSWLAALEGTSCGEFGFVLPHRCADLDAWGELMANCLGGFRSAAVQGRSHLVGVTVAGRLRYVIEITPRREIRQFSGPANRAVPRDDHDRIVSDLHARGVLL